jgi:hypothetical protein
MRLFKNKQREIALMAKQREIIREVVEGKIGEIIDFKNVPDSYLGVFSEGVIMSNTVALFTGIPEIAFPVLQVARGISDGKYQLKLVKTDEVVYDVPEMNQFLSRPHPLYSFREMITLLACYKLVTGKAYLYGGTGFDTLSARRWKYCKSYFVVPSQAVNTVLRPSPNLLSGTSIGEIVDHYDISAATGIVSIRPSEVMHVRDGSLSFDGSYVEGASRLSSQKYPVCNLIASYEARNAIFVNRGALGALVSNKKDAGGYDPLTQKERDEVIKEYNNTYGTTSGKSPIMITSAPLSFVRFAMSIQEMQPFDEHLEDAVQIAGAFGVPADLIPRKDKSTYENQRGAKKSLYVDAVIPEARSLVQSLNDFLGLENDGLYLDVSFDHVPELQPDRRVEAETGKIISETCEREFQRGIITLNDWIAKTGGEKKDGEIYKKYILDMSDEELAQLQRVGFQVAVTSNDSKQ